MKKIQRKFSPKQAENIDDGHYKFKYQRGRNKFWNTKDYDRTAFEKLLDESLTTLNFE